MERVSNFASEIYFRSLHYFISGRWSKCFRGSILLQNKLQEVLCYQKSSFWEPFYGGSIFTMTISCFSDNSISDATTPTTSTGAPPPTDTPPTPHTVTSLPPTLTTPTSNTDVTFSNPTPHSSLSTSSTVSPAAG